MSTVAKAEGFDDEPGPSGIGRHQGEEDYEDGHSDAESVAASDLETASVPVAEGEADSEPAITALGKLGPASWQAAATGQHATGMVYLQADKIVLL